MILGRIPQYRTQIRRIRTLQYNSRARNCSTYSSAVSGGFSLKTQMSWKTSSRIEFSFSFSSSSFSPLSVSLYLYVCLSLSVPSNWPSKPSTVLVSQSSASPSQSTVLFSNTATVCTRTKLAAIINRYLGGRRNSQTDIFLDMIIKTPATQLMQRNSSQKHKVDHNQSINHEFAHLCSHCNFQQVHNKN
jgi:hypothetical protein